MAEVSGSCAMSLTEISCPSRASISASWSVHRFIDTTRAGASARRGVAAASARPAAASAWMIRSEPRTKANGKRPVACAVAGGRLVFFIEHVVHPEVKLGAVIHGIADGCVKDDIIVERVAREARDCGVDRCFGPHVETDLIGDVASQTQHAMMARDAGQPCAIGAGVGVGVVAIGPPLPRDVVDTRQFDPLADGRAGHLVVAAETGPAGDGGPVEIDQVVDLGVEGRGAELAPGEGALDADLETQAFLGLEVGVAEAAEKLEQRRGAETGADRGAQDGVAVRSPGQRDASRGLRAEAGVI